MPVINGKDKQGSFYRWGDSGHKYYYITKDKLSREAAKDKAALQGRAIMFSRNLNRKK